MAKPFILTSNFLVNPNSPSNVEISNLINETKNLLLNFKIDEKNDKRQDANESIESSGALSHKDDHTYISKDSNNMFSSLNLSQLRNKNRPNSKSHSTVININSAPQNNKTIINKLTLNVLNPTSSTTQISQPERSMIKSNTAKYNNIGLSNLESERENLNVNNMNSKISSGNAFLSHKGNYATIVADNTKVITKSQSILGEFKRNKDS
jgi:hypothetical protein